MDSITLNISASTVTAGTISVFSISQILNPPSTESLTGIQIISVDSNGYTIDSCQASLTVKIELILIIYSHQI